MKMIKSILIELDPDLQRALEQFMVDTGDVISPAEALRAAFRDWAILQGYLKELAIDEEPPIEGDA